MHKMSRNKRNGLTDTHIHTKLYVTHHFSSQPAKLWSASVCQSIILQSAFHCRIHTPSRVGHSKCVYCLKAKTTYLQKTSRIEINFDQTQTDSSHREIPIKPRGLLGLP